MEDVNKFINGDEVISIENENENILINHRTYKAKDFLCKLAQNLDYSKGKKWLSDGVSCEILSPNQNWQSGKIKICLQFIPEQPESVLDDIRQENQ
jgi:hypothetical protein